MPATKNGAPALSIFLTILSVLLIVFGAIGLIYVQTPLQEGSFDTRRAASVDNGQVLVSFIPDNQAFTVGRESAIDILVNTQNLNTTGVEFVFNVVTNTVDELNLRTYSDANLQVVSQEIEQTDDGYLVSYKAVAPTGKTFLSTSPKRVMSLVFTPQRTGDLKLAFDAEKSTSYKVNTSPAEDLLKTVGTETYIVQSGSSSSVKSCNESCSSNGECPVNHRCYENRCRLVTNVSSTTCAKPPDLGIQRTCNQYCADVSECAKGYSCYYNRCRRPDNVESTTCSLPTAALQNAIRQSCNKGCSSNGECANNMRCYFGQCRLATNPSSTSCSATTSRSVSSVYYTVPAPTKGEEAPADRVSPIPSARPATGSALPRPLSGTQSGQATGSGFVSPRPSTNPSVKPSPVITPLPESKPGILSRLSIGGFSLPLIALAVGIGLLILVIIVTIINMFRRRGSGSASVGGNSYQKTQAYEAELQDKINALKSQQGSQPAAPVAAAQPKPEPIKPEPPKFEPPKSEKSEASMTPPPSTLVTQRPTSNISSTASVAPEPTPTSSAPASTSASTPEPTTNQPSGGSSMLDRIRQKGITPPGSDSSP